MVLLGLDDLINDLVDHSQSVRHNLSHQSSHRSQPSLQKDHKSDKNIKEDSKAEVNENVDIKNQVLMSNYYFVFVFFTLGIYMNYI